MPARTVGRIVSYIVLVLIGLIALAPFVFLLIISFKSRIDVLQVPPSLHFSTAQIKDNYSQVINDKGFLTFIKNSVIVTGISTLIALGLGVPAGYAFSRLKFRASGHWASTILSFRFMPPVAVAIPIYLMIRDLGLVNSYLGLILPYVAFSLPLVVWIMIGFFDEIPREIDDAALVDGCSRASALFRVLLHIVNSSSRETIPIAASALLTVESPIDWNLAAATGILTVIPVLLFSLFVQRYIVRGITAGAVR